MISLCSVVYNEGHRVYDFLAKNAKHVDEVVIVDQSSTDKTIDEIDRWYYDSGVGGGFVRVAHDIHRGYCEPSRKLAQDHARGDWILVLDADEEIDGPTINMLYLLTQPGYLGQFRGARLKRSLWINGAHSWTGDYQYRFFHKDAVRYLDEMHTEPQPTIGEGQILYPEQVGIWHRKSWTEQIRDEQAYEEAISDADPRAQAKRDLNVYSKMVRQYGEIIGRPVEFGHELHYLAQELDTWTPEETTKFFNLRSFDE